MSPFTPSSVGSKCWIENLDVGDKPLAEFVNLMEFSVESSTRMRRLS